MPYYRITLTPLSPLGTPLVSGTLWGHMAWAIRYREGEDGMRSWLSEQEENPWLLSSFMPKGMLPRPLLKPTVGGGVLRSLEEMRADKRARKEKFFREEIFITIRDSLSETALEKAFKEERKERDRSQGKLKIVRAHNRIDRLTNTTPESGGLYFEEVELFEKGASLQGFMYTREQAIEKIRDLLEFIGTNGFGSNASTGNGYFQCEVREETRLFSHSGNRAMSLSHGVLSSNMKEARYKQHVHFGKLGGQYSKGSFSPFKYPILMMSPGATFTAGDNGPFGKLLDGVHHDPALASVRHHALHLPLFFTEVER